MIAPRFRRLPAVLTLLVLALAASAAQAAGATIKLRPSGGDDTAAIESAIAIAGAGGDGTIELAAGTFRISRAIIVWTPALTIKGAGMGKTTVIADASLSPGGLYPNLSAPGGVGGPPFLFLFPVLSEGARSWSLRDLTLGTSGPTEMHFDPNANANTDRLFSLVWVVGFHGDWRNSAGQTPTDKGEIDAEHRVLSTVRFRCENVFFDGKNRDRTAKDVRNAFGMEGGFVFSHFENGEEVIDWLFKPINSALSFKGCRFADLPGQAGIFAPAVIGKGDPSWTFGPDAVEGEIIVRGCDFVRTLLPLLLSNLSATRVVVEECSIRESDVGVVLSNDLQRGAFAGIGYPDTALCKLVVADSKLRDAGSADVFIGEFGGGHTVDAVIRDTQFRLNGAGGVGVQLLGSQGAVIRDCEFDGLGYAGIFALDAEDLRLVDDDFCCLAPSNPEGASVVVAGTTSIRSRDNECLDFFTEPPPAGD